MKHIGSFALGAALLLGLPALGQQSGTSSLAVTDSSGIPTVQAQMKLFTSRLDLSNDQQTKLVPILEDLHDATARAVRDEARTAHERLLQVHTARLAADRKIRDILTDEQKSKLDTIEHEPHPERHGPVDEALHAQQ